MDLNNPQLQPIFLLLGFLLVSNFGTIAMIVLKIRSQSQKAESKRDDLIMLKLDELKKELSNLSAQLSKLEGKFEVALPHVQDIPRLKNDLNALWAKTRTNA